MNPAIGLALILRLWRQHRLALGFLALGVGLFEFVITQVAPAPGAIGFFGGLAVLLPKEIVAMMGGELMLASARGVIAFGYLHPFFLTILSAWTIRVAAGPLAGEIGRGTMDLLAARPIRRWQLVVAAWIAIAAGLAALTVAAWTGTAIGLQTRTLGVSPREIAAVPVMAWLLFATWGGVAVFISATRRDAGPAIAWIAGVMATSFVLEFLARVWQPLAWARPGSLFAYYRPQEIAALGIVWADVLLLGAIGAIAIAAAIGVFERRDL